jgi:hypothetical protein
MASKAQFTYAQNIVKYFDRHPEAGVDVTVDEVLDDIDRYVEIHTLHKESRPWLTAEARETVRAELVRVGSRVLDRRLDLNRATNALVAGSIRRRAGDPPSGLTAAADAAKERVTEALQLARQAVERLRAEHPDHERHIEMIAVSTGAL